MSNYINCHYCRDWRRDSPIKILPTVLLCILTFCNTQESSYLFPIKWYRLKSEMIWAKFAGLAESSTDQSQSLIFSQTEFIYFDVSFKYYSKTSSGSFIRQLRDSKQILTILNELTGMLYHVKIIIFSKCH